MAFPTLQCLLILLIPGNSEGFEAAPMAFTLQRFLSLFVVLLLLLLLNKNGLARLYSSETGFD